MKTLNCLVVDDNRMSLKILKALIGQTPFLHLVGLYDNAIEAAQALMDEPVDILFLDVEMPDMTGLQLLDTLTTRPQVIITSSRQEYAIDAFEYDVVDFLLKPIDNYSRFFRAVRKAKSNLDKPSLQADISSAGTSAPDRVFIKVDSLLVNCELKDVLWVEAFGDYVKIHTIKTTHVVHTKLRVLEETLPSKDFVRVHRSFIVRIDKIKNIDSTNLQIEKIIIPVSNSYRRLLLEKINIVGLQLPIRT